MIISKLARIQLIVFVVVGLIGIAIVGANYARLDRLVGIGAYNVTAQFTDSGGIFTNAQVTYMGIPAGRVGDMRLTPDGVDVILELDSDGPGIPANSTAVVSSRSAIGEQYVDLQPNSVDGELLADGSIITNTAVPAPLEDVMESALNFTESIPLDDLHTVITELGKAFTGQSENLTRLMNSLDTLAAAGADNITETINLIQNSNVVLGTQAEQRDEILNWSQSLDLVTATLASADPDVRRLLTTGTASATQISSLIQQTGGDLATVVDQLADVTRTIGPTSFATSSSVAMLSALSAGSLSVAGRDGQVQFGIVLETNNPPACTRGYESTQELMDRMRRENPDFDPNYDDFPFNTEARCTVPQGNPTSVRGAARAPLADPSIPQPWDNTPKKDPDRLNLTPLAEQMAALLGIRPR